LKSVTDDIVEEIVEEIVTWCKQNKQQSYSREVLVEDCIRTSYASALINEIEAKLKAKGITIVT